MGTRRKPNLNGTRFALCLVFLSHLLVGINNAARVDGGPEEGVRKRDRTTHGRTDRQTHIALRPETLGLGDECMEGAERL